MEEQGVIKVAVSLIDRFASAVVASVPRSL